MNIPVIPADKANHLAYGALLACLGALAAGPVIGAALCLFFAIAKESFDRITKRGNPELMDAVWTAAGGALVLVPLVIDPLAH